MTWRVLVHNKPAFIDHHGEAVLKAWRHAGGKNVRRVRVGQAYELSGDIPEAVAQRVADKLLTDPVTQEFSIFASEQQQAPEGARCAEVWLKKGVADPVADTVVVAARDLGVELAGVRSGRAFDFFGAAEPAVVRAFCEDYLMNPLVQSAEVL